MRLKNNRGEVFTLTVIVIAAIAAFLLGTSNNPIKSLFGFSSSSQKIKSTSITKSESKPVFVKGTDGKTYVLQAMKTETSTLDSVEEPKTTLWQKLMMLPKLWLLLMILGIFFPPIAGIMQFINKKLMGEATKIVGGVEEALKKVEEKDPAVKKEILDTLSKKYDSSTKLLVSKLKRKI